MENLGAVPISLVFVFINYRDVPPEEGAKQRGQSRPKDVSDSGS